MENKDRKALDRVTTAMNMHDEHRLDSQAPDRGLGKRKSHAAKRRHRHRRAPKYPESENLIAEECIRPYGIE